MIKEMNLHRGINERTNSRNPKPLAINVEMKSVKKMKTLEETWKHNEDLELLYLGIC